MKNKQEYTGLEIAVIGMACRFPGAADWRAYWHNLVNGISSVHFYTDEELAVLGVNAEDLQRPDFVKAGAVLEDKGSFDPSFFGYRPDEARLLNPVHRIFHECAWEALEDAGYDPAAVKGGIGVYAGGGNDLNWQVYTTLKNESQEVDGFTLSQLNNKDYLATLLSYKLNLKGPAFSINTACSTSLVAINQACKGLLMGEARIALAGGVSINTLQQKGYFYQEGMIDSRDGYCRAFDAQANGCVGGEGAGVVVLKRLQDALKDGDHIYAVIKGSAINNDGNRKVGFTAPSIEGQADCIRKAMAIAGVAASTIGYVEAHGTGTRLGDPIEVAALNMAFNGGGIGSCALGSVKTNIGHLDTAAGVAGFIKTALSLKHRQLPPSLHFTNSNPEIDFAGGPFYVNNILRTWDAGEHPLRAGVSSFGIGGTNAHVILEEAPAVEDAPEGRPWKIFTASAQTPQAIERYLKKMNAFLDTAPVLSLADVSFTLQTGRRHFAYRHAFAYRDQEDLQRWLQIGVPPTGINKAREQRTGVIFMFPGQGSQYANMARQLYEQEGLFREIIDEGYKIITALSGLQLRDSWFTDTDGERINQTGYTQPAIFLLEYAMAKMLMAWGIVPDLMIGHSIGELVAACVSGVLSFPDALKVVVKRASLMNALPGGIMLSIPLGLDAVTALLNEDISIAAINAPEQVVLSGSSAAMEKLMQHLDQQEITYIRLHTSHAFHSAMLDPILEDFRRELETVTWRPMHIPFISNVTGELITAEMATSPAYWVQHMRAPVMLSDGIRTMQDMYPDGVYIEAGAGHTLSGLLKHHVGDGAIPATVQTIRAARQSGEDGNVLAAALAKIWSYGIDINWSHYYQGEQRRKVPLPTYSFERIAHPVEVDPLAYANSVGQQVIPSSTTQQWPDWLYYPVWKSSGPVTVTTETRSFLFLSNGDALAAALIRLLSDAGHQVTEVIAGEAYEHLSAGKCTVNPSDKTQFRQLSAALREQDIVITDVIYAWGMMPEDTLLTLEEDNPVMTRGYFSLLYLVQALGLHGIHITLLTANLHVINAGDDSRYIQSLLLGLMNVLPQELPVSCSNIDIDGTSGSITGLYKELSGPRHMDRIIALRNNNRWIRDYQQNKLPVQSGSAIKKDGIYLITGGLGSIGFILAKHLMTAYQATVVITGRRDMDQCPENDVAYSRLKQLQALGTGVYYYRCDVADPSSLEETVMHVLAEIGPIQGVIHAAGNIDRHYFELAEESSWEKTVQILKPKIAGIQHVYRVFKTLQPDFVWITSSLASVLGGLGFSAYAAANIFMDHFISSFIEQLPTWKCIGLSELVLDDGGVDKEKRGSRLALLPTELISLFEWSTGLQGYPVILQTIPDLRQRIQKAFQPRTAVSAEAIFQSSGAVLVQRPVLSAPFAAPVTTTELILTDIMQQYFGFAEIGIDDNFFELGGDSLKAMILLKRIKKEFAVHFTVHDFFETRTIREMAVAIDNRLWLNKNEDKESAFVSII